jgi:biopolymer transport protein ExbB
VLNHYKVGKHFQLEIEEQEFAFRRDEARIAAEAALDGLYVIRTSVEEGAFSSENTVRAYKDLAKVERAFRSMKTIDLHVRPIFHWLDERIQAHVFLCMLSYYVEWHMRQRLAAVLFDDHDRESAEASRQSIVAPKGLVDKVLAEYRVTGVTPELLAKTAQQGPLGRVLSAGLANVKSPRPVMKESIEEVGRIVTHDLDRFLTTLGTIAAMAPLLGLFGTVVGMIEIFGSQTAAGSNPIQLAHGISVALYNTAFGLIVAIPSMIFYRHFRARVDALIVEMEQQAIRLVDFAHGDRR